MLIEKENNIEINGREFTRFMGGFGEDKVIVTDKQLGELLNYNIGARQVRRQLEENIKHFQEGVDYINLKVVQDTHDNCNDVLKSHNNSKLLTSLNYSKMEIGKANNIYIFSEAGFLLYLKFAEGDKAVSLYKDFIEKYFRTVAQKKVLELSIEQDIINLEDKRALLLGKMFMEADSKRKLEYFNDSEELNRSIQQKKITIASVNSLTAVKSQLALADSFSQSKHNWDIGVFCKSIDVEGLGRNNMFKLLKSKNIIMENNTPYQKYSKYFKVIPVVKEQLGRVDNKLLIKPEGVKFLFNMLIKDNIIISKTFEEVKENLLKEVS
jgi:hypothetical protein